MKALPIMDHVSDAAKPHRQAHTSHGPSSGTLLIMEMYVLLDGSNVVAVRPHFKQVMTAADLLDVNRAHRPFTEPWQEIGPGDHCLNAWERVSGRHVQTIELHSTDASA